MLRAPRRARRAADGGLRRVRRAARPRAAPHARAHAAGARPRRPRALRAAGRSRRGPARLPAHARPAAAPRARRPPGDAGPQGGRPHGRRRRARCGSADRWTLARSTASGPRRRAAARELAERLAAELQRAVRRAAPARRARARRHRGTGRRPSCAPAAAALEQLATLARADRALAPQPDELAALLHDLDVFVGDRARRPASSPSPTRCRCARGAYGSSSPAACRRGRSRPRRAPSRSSPTPSASRSPPPPGLRLRRRDDLGAERFLFYATVSRPQERLYLSWHEAGDDGEPAVRSFFVSDVCDLFGPELQERRRMRVARPGRLARRRGAERARAPARARRPAARAGARRRSRRCATSALVAALRDRPAWSASGDRAVGELPGEVVRRAACCGPRGSTPDPEAMLRGALTHTGARGGRCAGSSRRRRGPARRRDAAGRPRARGHARSSASPGPSDHDVARPEPPARACCAGCTPTCCATSSTPRTRHRASRRRARGRLRRSADDEHPPLELAGGVRLRGRIDRIDAGPDGSRRSSTTTRAGSRSSRRSWRAKRKLQVALYMLAARDVLGLEPRRRPVPADRRARAARPRAAAAATPTRT